MALEGTFEWDTSGAPSAAVVTILLATPALLSYLLHSTTPLKDYMKA